LILRGCGFEGGRARDELVSHLDIFPTICELAGIEPPSWLQDGRSSPLMDPEHGPAESTEIFAELTYHAAYEPRRAIRTDRYKYTRRFDGSYPVLANCDDSPSKEAYLARGWASRPVARQALHDLFFNPGEGRDVIDEPAYAEVAAELRRRLEESMERTDDPLLRGPLSPPPGALVNTQDQVSPTDPLVCVDSDGFAGAISVRERV
jgi:N-sulfoglucosamine sulfohydrolase